MCYKRRSMKRHIVASIVPLVILLSACANSESTATLLAAQATPADAVTADPAHYTVLFENDVARLIRVKYPRGTKSVMHSHPAGCAIFYKDSKFKMVSPTNESQTF